MPPVGIADLFGDSYGAAVCGTASADITSANTVGFTTINLEAGKWYLVAPQFKEVGADGMVDLLKVATFKGLTPVAFSDSDTACQIQIYNPVAGGYDHIYYYINNGRRTGDPDTGHLIGWGESRNLAAEMPIEAARGFWLQVQGCEDGATLTVAGEVKAETSLKINVGGDAGAWQILCNPYPMALTVDNLVTEGIEPVAFADADSGAQIQVYNPAAGGYDHIYYYINNGRRSGDPDTGHLIGWGESRNLATGVIAEPGRAFWVKSPTEGSLTFKFN